MVKSDLAAISSRTDLYTMKFYPIYDIFWLFSSGLSRLHSYVSQYGHALATLPRKKGPAPRPPSVEPPGAGNGPLEFAAYYDVSPSRHIVFFDELSSGEFERTLSLEMSQ